MAKKKKEPVKIWYTLTEASLVAKIYTNEVRQVVKDEKITIEIREGYIFINKIEFDEYLRNE